jgi:hypothetical protein
MDAFQIFLLIFVFLGITAAVLQTFGSQSWKSYFQQELDPFLSSITKSILGLLGITFIMILFIRTARNREGFQNPDTFTKQLQGQLRTLQAETICRIFGEIEKNIFESEKVPIAFEGGKESVTPSDTEAKERTRTTLSRSLSAGVLDCGLIKALLAVELTDDSLYGKLSEVPDDLYIQLYQALEYSSQETEKALNEFKKSLDVRVAEEPPNVFEQFMDLCPPEVAEQRRKFLREQKLTEQQQQCLLPEEVPPAEKDPVMKRKLDTMQTRYTNFLRSSSNRPTIELLIERYKTSKAELEKYKQKAEQGELQEDIKV